MQSAAFVPFFISSAKMIVCQYTTQPWLHRSTIFLQARSQRPCSPQHKPAAVIDSTALHGAAPVLHEAPDQAAGSQPPAAEEADEDEPETMPLLARRVMAGRQSIIPGHQKVGAEQDILIIFSTGMDLQASHGACAP